MPVSVRPSSRIAANQYAKNRVDLFLLRKFFEELLIALIDRDNRNLFAALESARQVPAKVREGKQLAQATVRSWAALDAVSARPQVEFKAALGRGVRQLSGTKDPEKEKRLRAYESLQSGDLDSDLGQISDELEELGRKIQTAVKEHQEEKQASRKDKVGAFLDRRRHHSYWY